MPRKLKPSNSKLPTPPPERTCVYCGCTEDRACPGGCSWAVVHRSDRPEPSGPPLPLTGVCTNEYCLERLMNDAAAVAAGIGDKRVSRFRALSLPTGGPRYWAVVVTRPHYVTPARSKCRFDRRPALPELRAWGAFNKFNGYQKDMTISVSEVSLELYEALSEFSWIRP